MCGLMNTTVFIQAHAPTSVQLTRLASQRGATINPFRTLQEAQRARAIRWNKTWAYNAWEVLIMMPLKTLVCGGNRHLAHHSQHAAPRHEQVW
jgi:hypothetical protein